MDQTTSSIIWSYHAFPPMHVITYNFKGYEVFKHSGQRDK